MIYFNSVVASSSVDDDRAAMKKVLDRDDDYISIVNLIAQNLSFF